MSVNAEHETEEFGPEASVEAEAPGEEAASLGRSGDLGTFQGVFRPTVLTILGLMMYLREGWVVGQAGLLGAILVILLTFLITGTSALSLSSVSTNIHVGPGGVFSIISQSLGLESGGSIGIPLYLGQALSTALYLYGFTEAWLYIFPSHPALLVVYVALAVIFATVIASTRLAFKLQGVVMVIIIASLLSIIFGAIQISREAELHTPQLWGTFEGGGFWLLFAIFFPGGTGVKVGASMSGALKNPRKSIPRGTLAAVATALTVYIGMAIWYSLVATPEALRTDRLIVIEKAAIGELVLAGILASTFTAALSAMVAAPRVLQALAQHDIVPRSDLMKREAETGEPRNAIIFTGVLVAAALLLGGLDAVAQLITMFFLLIYLTINSVVAIEQALGLIAFRPTLKVPYWVPLLGIVGSSFALFIISPIFALVAIGIVVVLYIYLVRRHLASPWQTVRSGIFVSLADWASKRLARSTDEANERAWKPDLLVPVTSRGQLDGMFRFLRLLAEPKGSLKIIGIRSTEDADEPAPQIEYRRGIPAEQSDSSELIDPREDDGLDTLERSTRSFQDKELMATSTIIRAPSLVEGISMSASVLRGSAFRPNVLFGQAHRLEQEELQRFVDIAAENEMGVALLYEHLEASLGQEQRINVWISDQSPEWKLGLRLPNLDLSVLLAYQILQKWQGDLRLLTVCRDPNERPRAKEYLQRLTEDARLPDRSKIWVSSGQFLEQLEEAPEADLSVLGLAREIDRHFMEEAVRATHSSCLFVRDSGWESALA